LGELAQVLRDRGLDPHKVARFLDRLIFAMFAEDIALLPEGLVSQIFDTARQHPERFQRMAGTLFAAMAQGGEFGVHPIRHFNGNLYDDAEALALQRKELEILYQAARLDWAAIDPSIFGTLFERGLDPSKRSQIGAHYTSREDIETLVEPVIMTPLRREWDEARATAESLLRTGHKKPTAGAPPKELSGAALAKARREAGLLIERFLDRLERVTILDPACGSGNFLYVALQKLLDLEHQVRRFAIDHNFPTLLRIGVGPWQLYGIEINDYAAELAQMTVWIGYLQWLHNHGTGKWKEPILTAMSNIECRDAILEFSDDGSSKEPAWPRADLILGNPPFLGGKLMRRGLGDKYVNSLFALWDGRVPREADLCCYWFEKAREEIQAGRCNRAGLLATQGIRGGANREVVERLKETGDLFFAVADRDWILDGAAVHVSMIGFDGGLEEERILDGRRVSAINSDLTAGPDLTKAATLPANLSISFMGITPAGRFDVSEAEASAWLREPNPHSRPNSDVLRPYFNGSDLTGRPRKQWTIDFHALTAEQAFLYTAPLSYLRVNVYPERQKNNRAAYRENWWLFAEGRSGMRKAFSGHSRYLATSMVAKHRTYSWLDTVSLPANVVIVFARSDDYFFGILHSRVHEVWALAKGTQLREKESGSRYTPTTCFETFPFPRPSEQQQSVIAAVASELDDLREAWLNPREWTREEVLEFPASVDGPWKRHISNRGSRGIGTARYRRRVPKDPECMQSLLERTLTELYNERPDWLLDIHRRLDEAVFAAYGWPPEISEDELLDRLLALNLERSLATQDETRISSPSTA
jgi:hypothetical protein